MATLQERIDAIEAILDRGVDETELQDGRRVRHDLAELRIQRDRLVAQLAAETAPRRLIISPTSGVEC